MFLRRNENFPWKIIEKTVGEKWRCGGEGIKKDKWVNWNVFPIKEIKIILQA